MNESSGTRDAERASPRAWQRGFPAIALAAVAVLAGCGTESGAGGGTNGGGTTGGMAGGDSSRGTEPGGGGSVPGAIGLSSVEWIPERVTLGGEEYVRPADDTSSYLEIRPGRSQDSGGHFGGNSGGRLACNSFGADVAIDGDTMRVGEVVTTLVGCEPDHGEFASRFLEVFGNSDLTYRVDDVGDHPHAPTTLTLTNSAGDAIDLRLADDPRTTGS